MLIIDPNISHIIATVLVLIPLWILISWLSNKLKIDSGLLGAVLISLLLIVIGVVYLCTGAIFYAAGLEPIPAWGAVVFLIVGIIMCYLASNRIRQLLKKRAAAKGNEESNNGHG